MPPKTKSFPHSVTVTLTEDQYHALDEFSNRTGIPKVRIIRRGIDMALGELEQRERAAEEVDDG